MLGTVLNWVSGGVLGRILDYFENRHRVELAAASEDKRLEHEKQADVRRNAKEIRMATANFWEMRLLTFLIAFPFVYHLWTVWLDTQFKLGWAVDKFPPPFDEWQAQILLSFFGLVGVVGSVKAVSGAIAYTRRR